MKKTSIILIISLIICLFCVISISVAPVINNLLDNFTTWGKLNCELYSDIAEYSSTINTHFENQKLKNLCRRQNAMYSLEYSAFIINIFIAAILAQITLIHLFDKGFGFERTTGLIGFIGGIVTFILMLVYVCFSGYISFVSVYEKDKSDDAQYVKYKDLGDSQYNYNKKYYEAYHYTIENGGACISDIGSGCDYGFAAPFEDNKNKYLYNRWCLCLVLAVFVVLLNAALGAFGFLVFKEGENDDNKVISVV